MSEPGAAESTASTQASRTGERAPRSKVIYVMGAGRSGSTILGVALGNCARCFYAGELDKWLLMSGESMHERARAEAGEPSEPGIWSRVREDVAAPADLFGRDARSCIEHSSSLFRPHKLRTRR